MKKPLQEFASPLDTPVQLWNEAEQTPPKAHMSGKGCIGIDPGTVGGSFGLVFDFPDWKPENYVFMPGTVYAGNRFPATPQPYPPLPMAKPIDSSPDALQVTDIARLNFESGPSKLEQLSLDMATPGVGIWLKDREKAFLLLAPQLHAGEPITFTLTESLDRTSAQLRISAAAGDHSEPLELYLASFPCRSQAEFFAYFWAHRHERLQARPRHEEIPFSACWDILHRKHNEQNWWEAKGFYKVGLLEHPTQIWQAGWTGGLIATLPLLQEGDAASVERVARNFDFIFPEGLSPFGLPYGMGDGTRWLSDTELQNGEPWHLIRKTADVLYFGLRQLDLFRTRNIPIKPEWTDGLHRCAEALASIWERNGQFGQFIDQNTGEIIVPHSTCGALAPAALVLAAREFEEPRLLEIAKAAGRYFLEVDLELGVTSGGPGDMSQCPDSESAYALIESYALLWDASSEEVWLEAGRLAAAHAASWTLSYDYAFPAESMLGQMDMRSHGTMLANSQNKTGVPGICTLSGEGLLRLYRATGEIAFLDLLVDVAHAIPQFMSRKDRPISAKLPWPEGAKPQLEEGTICERVNITPNWPEAIGEVANYSCWCEVALMLTWSDLPGVYWNLDTNEVRALDHVTALVSPCGNELLLSNPTKFDAQVKILTESTQDRAQALPINFGSKLPTVHIPARSQTTYRKASAVVDASTSGAAD